MQCVCGISQRKELLSPHHQERISEPLAGAQQALREQVCAPRGKIQMCQDFFLLKSCLQADAYLPFLLQPRSSLAPKQKARLKIQHAKGLPASCPWDLGETEWRWGPGICIVSKHPGELGTGNHVVAWPLFVCQDAQLQTQAFFMLPLDVM